MAKKKHPGGRPTVMTKEVIGKLEEVFAIGGSDSEACFYANISKDSLYDYCKKHPEFSDRKEALKEKPILKARQTVVKGLDDINNAHWFLERKRKKEFSTRTEVIDDTEKKTDVNVNINLEAIRKKFNEEVKSQIIKEIKKANKEINKTS